MSALLRIGDVDRTLSPLRLSHIEALQARIGSLEGTDLHAQLEFALSAIQMSLSIRHPEVTVEALRAALDVSMVHAAFLEICSISRGANLDAQQAPPRRVRRLQRQRSRR